MATIPVLLDTDLGSDIDDALALAYLLQQPRCELLGITTVSGNVAQRASIADVVCRAFGRPGMNIRTGQSETLADGPGQPNVPHYAAIQHLPHRRDFLPDAVDYLRESIRARPHQVVLLSIGPLTNLSLLFALDPELLGLLRGLVSMAGSFFRGDEREWNCLCDPGATMSTLKRSTGHDLVGLDVTLHCQMPAAEVRERFALPPLEVILAMAEKWFEHSKVVTFHDPLAAALIFEPSLCTFESGTVTSSRDGHTAFTLSPEGPHRVAASVDSVAFFQEYFRVLAGPHS